MLQKKPHLFNFSRFFINIANDFKEYHDMELVIGLLIIAIGAFCQSSSYVPINKIKDWSWESYWLV